MCLGVCAVTSAVLMQQRIEPALHRHHLQTIAEFDVFPAEVAPRIECKYFFTI